MLLIVPWFTNGNTAVHLSKLTYMSHIQESQIEVLSFESEIALKPDFEDIDFFFQSVSHLQTEKLTYFFN